MKRSLYALGLLLWASQNAMAVSDTFECRANIHDSKGTALFLGGTTLAAAREPEISVLGILFTKGSIGYRAADLDGNKKSVAFTINYRHALKQKADGTWIASQYTCGVFESSIDGAVISSKCGPPSDDDPFSPQSDWHQVDIYDGVPRFDTNSQIESEAEIKTVNGLYKITWGCDFRYTLK